MQPLPAHSPSPHLSSPAAHPPTPADPAALRAFAVAAASDPWLASVFMRRLDALAARLTELRAWLTGLSRRTRRAMARRWALAAPVAALLLALGVGPAQAATITVDPGGSGCTLADAIDAANTDTATGSCGAGSGPDTINFATANQSYGYTTALPAITTAITIQGNGNTTIARTGGPSFRVLTVLGSGASLELRNATITGGFAEGEDGGGILVGEGTLRLLDSTVTGNSAEYDGGGIMLYDAVAYLSNATISGNSASDDGGGIDMAYASVDIVGSTISGNTASDAAGGIRMFSSDVTITDSTISGNTGVDDIGGIGASGDTTLTLTNVTVSGNSTDEDGGGIAIYATAVLTNVTISGNTAGDKGGGIYNQGTITLTHTTITGNSAGDVGGGIYNDDEATIASSIVAGQIGGGNCTGTLTSNGYNIESGTTCGFTATGDQQNVTPAQLDLGPLALNAPGTTQTHALGAASAALNQIPLGTNGCGTSVDEDQRGVARPQLTLCDVGAFELEAAVNPTPVPPTAARLVDFTAAPDPTGRVRIAWETASEVDVVGFRVQRAQADLRDPRSPRAAWTAVGGLVPARGHAAGGATYALADTPGVGRFTYRLEVVEAAGAPQTVGPVEAIVRAMRAFLPLGWRSSPER